MKIKLMLITIYLMLATIGYAKEIPQTSVDSHEFIRDWLLCGPISNPFPKEKLETQDNYISAGFDKDYLVNLGGEGAVKPYDGLQFKILEKSFTWQLYRGENDYIDFAKYYPKNQEVIAYAACQLISEKDETIFLGLGSDDGVKVWLNGEIVFESPLCRSAVKDEDFVRVKVKKGVNNLLLKVDQVIGGWGFYVRVLDRQEKINKLEQEFNAGIIRDIPFKIESNSERVSACFGEKSHYLILNQIPSWTLEVFKGHGELIRKQSADLGEAISFPKELFQEGPYSFHASVTLPDQEQIVANEYCFYGKSPHQLFSYDASGNSYLSSWYSDKGKYNHFPGTEKEDVVLLSRKYETVEKGTRLEEKGTYSIQRYDIHPFYMRVNLPTLSLLGARTYVLDNLGAGYEIQKRNPLNLDLPREALRCLQFQLKQRLKQAESPQWLCNNIEKTAFGCFTNGKGYSASDLSGARNAFKFERTS